MWIMRQAGRYLPGYQAFRRQHSFVEMCRRPEIATEVSLEPYREFGVDGVIVFYDILFLPQAMGAPLEYTERGPVFLRALRRSEDVRALHAPGPEAAAPVVETLKRLRATLPAETALLGFAGAPFTLAAYLVEGDLRRSGDRIRRLMHEDPSMLRGLLERLTTATVEYLAGQVRAGADAVQLFDTWAGLLGPADFREFALPYQQRIFEELNALDVPTVLYVNGCSSLLEWMGRCGARVLSLDWRVSLQDARRRLGNGVALQGNLDPAALFGSPETVRRRTLETLESLPGDPAYIFNLGHGILPETPVESVRALIETVRAFDGSAATTAEGND